jgi:hypothetical protein
VIVRGIEKKEIVTDNTDRNNFITRLGTLVTDTDMEVYSWALMSNHIHILIRKCSVSIAIKLFSEYGISIAEIARNTSISTSAVSKMVNKSINK